MRFPRNRIIIKSEEKKRTFWDYANSNLVLWVLTAVVGSFVTVVYSNQQSCLRDSEQRVLRFRNITSELLDRGRINIFSAKAASDGDSFQQLAGILKQVGNSDGKEKSGIQLASELRQEANSLHYDPSGIELPKLLDRHKLSKAEANVFFLFLRPVASETSDELLNLMKPVVDKAAGLMDELIELDSNWSIVPHCRIWDSVVAIFYPNRPTISVSASEPLPDYFKPALLVPTIQAMEAELKLAKEKAAKAPRRKTGK